MTTPEDRKSNSIESLGLDEKNILVILNEDALLGIIDYLDLLSKIKLLQSCKEFYNLIMKVHFPIEYRRFTLEGYRKQNMYYIPRKLRTQIHSIYLKRWKYLYLVRQFQEKYITEKLRPMQRLACSSPINRSDYESNAWWKLNKSR